MGWLLFREGSIKKKSMVGIFINILKQFEFVSMIKIMNTGESNFDRKIVTSSG